MIRLATIAIITVSLTACSRQMAPPPTGDVAHLVKMMTGSFGSGAQAAGDSSYYDISLHMYPIWQSSGEHYLYVEQALASMQDKPYRQRVYKVVAAGDQRYISYVYTLPDASKFIGAYKSDELWSQITPLDLEIREGCEVYLYPNGDGYSGKTKDKTCKSTLRGASYASSEVLIDQDGIVSWDQGWDDKGTQVWGATNGGYMFKKER